MGMFQYQCQRCRQVSTRVVSHKQRPRVVDCDFCGGTAEHVMSVPSPPVFTKGGFSASSGG